MQRYFDSVQNTSGDAVNGASIAVYNSQGGLATLYSDNGVTPLANPLTSDNTGQYSFYAANGTYSTVTTATGLTAKTEPGIVLFDPAEQLFVAAGSGAVARLAQDKMRDLVSVLDFGTVQQAVSAGPGMLWYPSGTYAVATTVAGLHDVPSFGPGAITRGGQTFHVSPTSGQTNTLFVSPTGNDTNDGLTTDFPLATLARASTILKNYGPMLDGSWVIQLAAGTYTQSNTDFAVILANLNRITIQGPIVGHPNVPTAIIDGGGTGAYGLNFNSRTVATISNIKFQNFTSFGVVAQDLADITATNVHVAGVSGGPGIKMQQGRLRIQGGILQTCQTGVTCIGGVTFTIGDPASASLVNGTQILNCTQGGILAQEQSSGHADFCTITNCAIGLDATVHSRFHAQGCAITNNATAGVRCTDSSSWFDNGTSANFSGNGNNELIYDAVGEIGRDGQRTVEQRQALDIAFVTVTGSVGATTAKTYATAIAANSFASQVKSYRVEIYGELSGVNNTKNVTMNLAGSPAFGFTIPAAATGSYRIVGTVRAQNGSAQSYSAVCDVTGQSSQVATGSRSINVMTGAAIPMTVVVTMNNAADSLTVRGVEQYNTGGC